jgi:hypothetical protein
MPAGNWERGLVGSGSAHMSGALPILATGGAGDVGMMDQFGLGGDMRWPSDGTGFLGNFVMDELGGSGDLGSDMDEYNEEDDDEEEDEEDEEDEGDEEDGDEVDEEDEDEQVDEHDEPEWADNEAGTALVQLIEEHLAHGDGDPGNQGEEEEGAERLDS